MHSDREQTRDSNMSEKKMIRRDIAVILGIICVILVASIVGTFTLLSAQVKDLHTQVNDLSGIVNFQKTETWLSNKTLTINPNQNASEYFYAPLGGNIEVIGYVQPVLPNSHWINLSWVVVYHYHPVNVYTGYPDPSVRNGFEDYFDYDFPIVSFGQNEGGPNVLLVIGNSLNYSSITVNLTVIFTY